MNDNSKREPNEDLVAYLDSELGEEAARGLEEQLARDPELRERLRQHQQAWDLLDEIPQVDASERFTQTTVEMVAVAAQKDVAQKDDQASSRRARIWVLAAALTVFFVAGSYAVFSNLLAQPNRQLVEDLPVIEELDAYRYAQDIAFLRELERAGLFDVEAEDAY